jgi:hypothetical protein
MKMRKKLTHLLIPYRRIISGMARETGKYMHAMAFPNQFTWSRVIPNSLTTGDDVNIS